MSEKIARKIVDIYAKYIVENRKRYNNVDWNNRDYIIRKFGKQELYKYFFDNETVLKYCR